MAKAIYPETAGEFTQQKTLVHRPDCICEECSVPYWGDHRLPPAVESTVIPLPASLPPPAPDWPPDHNPNNPCCYCSFCRNLVMEDVAALHGQGINCVAKTTSAGHSGMSGRPTAVASPCVRTTTDSYVHQQSGSVEDLEPSHKKSSGSSQEKAPKSRWICSMPGCTKSYQSATALQKHKDRHHEGQQICPYPNCGQFFQTDQDLKGHLGEHELKLPFPIKELKCSLCNKIFQTSRGLEKHERKQHKQ